MLFLYGFLLISKCASLKYSTLFYIIDDETYEMCLEESESIKKDKDEFCKDYTESNEYCQALMAIKDLMCTTPDNIQQTLKSVPADTNLLFITTNLYFSNTVNFKNLPKKMTVVFQVDGSNSYSEKIQRMQKIKFDGSQQKIIELLNMKSDTNRSKLDIKSSSYTWNFEGGIKSKVSFLALASTDYYYTYNYIKSENGQIDCETVYTQNFLPYGDNKFVVTHLIVDKNTHDEMSSSKFECQQYHYAVPYSYDYNYIQITFYESSWSFGYASSMYDDYYESVTVYHSWASQFGVITTSTNFDLYANYFSEIKPINISVLNLDESLNGDNYHTLEKQKIKITKSGSWPDLSSRVTLSVTTDLSKYEIDAASSFQNSNVNIKGVNVYKDTGSDGSGGSSGSSGNNGEKKEDSNTKKKIDKITTIVIVVVCVVFGGAFLAGMICLIVALVTKKAKIGNEASSEQ